MPIRTLPVAEDTIYLRRLSLTTTIAPGDVWSRQGKPTPVQLSVQLRLPARALAAPASSDDVEETISYGVLAKRLTGAIAAQKDGFGTLKHFAEFVRDEARALARAKNAQVDVEAVLGEGLLLAKGLGILLGADAEEGILFVDELRVACVVGVNPHERLQKQWVVINLTLWEMPSTLWTEYPAAVKKVVDVSCHALDLLARGCCVLISAQAVETSEYLTIETLATEVARVLCVESGVGKITVAVEKPSALTFAKGSGVQITRERAFFG
jgi:dihydroneopterin aldolase/2-amino-4-hydroxy-6-hydroxymethyldihydropteridine diphosphokinase/dihydropteroate synthase